MKTVSKPVFLSAGLLFFVIWILIYASSLSSMVTVWMSSETFKHCFIIIPVCLYLLYERRDELDEIEYKPVYWILAPLFLVQIMHLFGLLLGVNLIGHVSAYLSFVLIVWLILGNEFVRRFRFLLLYLAFIVPIGEELVPWLQDVTAYMSVEFLNWSGIPVYRDGLYLYIPNGTFLVAEACAGIRFLIAAIALGTLYAYMNFQTKWKFYGFIVLSIIVPIVANSIRAYGIIVIGYLTDMEHATGADHLVYGWFFFAFVLVLLFLIGERGKEKVDYRESSSKKELTFNISPMFFSVAIVLTLLPLLYAKAFIFKEYSNDGLAKLNLSESSWVSVPSEHDWAPIMFNAHKEWHGRFEDIPVYIAKYAYDNADNELVSGLNRTYNIETYTRNDIKIEQTAKGPIAILDLVNVQGRRIQVAYWYEVDGVRSVSNLKTKINQMKSKLAGDGGKGFLVAIVSNNPSDDAITIPTIGEL